MTTENILPDTVRQQLKDILASGKKIEPDVANRFENCLRPGEIWLCYEGYRTLLGIGLLDLDIVLLLLYTIIGVEFSGLPAHLSYSKSTTNNHLTRIKLCLVRLDVDFRKGRNPVWLQRELLRREIFRAGDYGMGIAAPTPIPKAWSSQKPPSSVLYDDELVLRLRQYLRERQPVLILGPPGCGKSELVHLVFCLEHVQPIPIDCSEDYTAEQLFGTMRLESGDSKVEYGPIPKAAAAGIPLLIEEIPSLLPGHVTVIRGALDRGIIDLSRFGLPSLEGKKGFTIWATGNPPYLGGLRSLNSPDIDRFNVEPLDYPTPNREVLFLRDSTRLSQLLLSAIVNVADDIRNNFKQGQLPNALSIRGTLRWAQALASKDGEITFDIFRQAAQRCMASIFNYFDPKERQAMEALLELHWPGKAR
jgi:MoxR-like ATPase